MSDATRILSRIQTGDPAAAAQLLPLVYDELRKLAAARLAHEKPGQTLQATALVHEAYLKLVGNDAPLWDGRGHFFAAAAQAMRQIMVDAARRKDSLKAGGQCERVELDAARIAAPGRSVDVIALSDALDALASHDRRKAELVKLRYFAGLTIHEAAQVLGVSDSTADADWVYAKSWLKVQLEA